MKVSIVIPAKNEESNMVLLLDRIYNVVSIPHEVIVVDDSDDNTAEVAEKMGAKVVKGQRKGLGQAIIDGISASKNEIVMVMDADLSHNPLYIARLLKPILEQGADFVIGSRYVKGGDSSNWSLNRRIKSLIGVKLMQLVTGVSDSNSGFFAFRRNIVDTKKLNGKTWKIMLEVLFKGEWVSKAEVPITFFDRTSGESKRSTKQVFRDAINVIRLLIWKFPKRYVNFAVVGGIGAISYYAVFWSITEYGNIWYGASYFIATMVAMTQNYIMNHYITFRKTKQTNTNHLRGFGVYFTSSWAGELVQYVVMLFLTEVFGIFYLLSDFIGSGFSSVIKYTIARKKIWHDYKRTSRSADYEWHSFYKGLPWQKRWKRIIARIVKEYAEGEKGNAGTILDVGCGSSPCGLLVSHNSYIGIDPNREKMEYMQNKGLSHCKFIHGDLDTITWLGQRCFDTVLFVEVIEHIDPVSARLYLRGIYELLNNGGKLIVATPNFGSFTGKWMDKLYGLFQKNAYASEHQTKYDLETLVEMCLGVGFTYITSKIPSGADIVCLFQKSG